MFKNLFAICLIVEDFEKSLTFYRDILDLEINHSESKFANFKIEGTELAIFEREAATTMFPAKFMKPSGGFLIGFQVGDLSQKCNILKKRGVSIFEGPKKTEWGQKVAYFHDPDENIWEISQK